MLPQHHIHHHLPMEPNARSITEELATDIQRAINALPSAHQVEPQDGKVVDNPRDGYI